MDKVSTKLINGFISQLSDLDFSYAFAQIQVVASIKELFKNYEVDKKDFCTYMGIKSSQYLKFTKGNYEYKLSDLVNIKYYGIKLYKEQKESESAVEFTFKNKA